jgi:protein TonB
MHLDMRGAAGAPSRMMLAISAAVVLEAVQDVSIAKSSGDDGLDEAAMNWVREHWRYKPAMKDGLPVVAQSEAQVVFSLRQSR